jgi:hypothetical protein
MFATLVIFDLLLLSHSLIFSLTNFLSGETKYSASTFVISSAIDYKFLLPLLVVQVRLCTKRQVKSKSCSGVVVAQLRIRTCWAENFIALPATTLPAYIRRSSRSSYVDHHFHCTGHYTRGNVRMVIGVITVLCRHGSHDSVLFSLREVYLFPSVCAEKKVSDGNGTRHSEDCHIDCGHSV